MLQPFVGVVIQLDLPHQFYVAIANSLIATKSRAWQINMLPPFHGVVIKPDLPYQFYVAIPKLSITTKCRVWQ
jgi:hypothetical protein